METTLHQQLKTLYAPGNAQTEVKLGKFRIDVVDQEQLIEIQHASLAAIRAKIQKLLQTYRVKVVKPVVERKYLVSLDRRNGRVKRRRLSPKRGVLLDVFDELTHFVPVYPHPNLILEVPLLDVEEYRYPGHGRRRRWRQNDFVVQDRKLLKLKGKYQFRESVDLRRLIDRHLPTPFDTANLADAMQINRGFAQRIAYCLVNTRAAARIGKRGNAWLYEFVD